MKVRIACLSLVLAMAVEGLSPAMAADFGYRAGGGIRDYGGGPAVPVPAPVPIPVYTGGWYLRLDAGVGIIDEPSLSETGFEYGRPDQYGIDTGAASPRSITSSWLNSDFDTFSTLGGGVGYDFGHGWRLDATVERRSNAKVQIDGSDHWDQYGYRTVGGAHQYQLIDANANGVPDGQTNFTVNDVTKIGGTVWMLNAYYDLAKWGAFTPYIGGGVGFVWNRLSRTHTDTVTTCANDAFPSCPTLSAPDETTVEKASDRVTFAAAAMAGISYELTDITTLDLGYRYLWLGGTDISLDINGDHSVLSIGDQHVHEMRAGVRFTFN